MRPDNAEGLNTPMHTQAFAGKHRSGGSCLLCDDGLVLLCFAYSAADVLLDWEIARAARGRWAPG